MADGHRMSHDDGDDDEQQHQYASGHAAALQRAPRVTAAAAASAPPPPPPPCPRCDEPLGDEVLEVDGFLACPACGFVIDDSILVHTLFAPGTEDEGGGGGGEHAAGAPLGVRVWHDDPTGQAAVARALRGRMGGGASAAVGREASYAAGREARRRRLHARLRAIMAALPGAAAALPRRAAADNAAALLERVDAAYHPPADEAATTTRHGHAMRAETLAAVAYVTAREAGAPITFAGAAGAAACAPLAVAREFLRLKAALRLTVPQAPLGTLVLAQGATLLRIARRGRGRVQASAAAAGGDALAPPQTATAAPAPAAGGPMPLLLPAPPTRSAAGGLATRDRPSAVIAAASLAASNRDLALQRARGGDDGASPSLPPLPATGARRVAAHPAVASALQLAELLQALGVAEARRRDAVAAACLKLCIGATPPKRGHAPLRKLSVAEVAAALDCGGGGGGAKAIGGAVRAAQAELRRLVPLLPFPVRFSDAGAHAGLMLRLHRLACKAQPPPAVAGAAPTRAALGAQEEEEAS
jgi:hypothetical protein